MRIFEPLIEHSDGKPPEHPLDVVAPILVLLLAVVIIAGLAMPLSFGTAVAGGSSTDALSSQSDAALGESDCQAIWSLAVRDNDRLSYDKATPYVSDLQAADPDNDGYVDKTEFMDACQKGLVHTASSSHVMLRKR